MRSRYTAYKLSLAKYIIKTTHKNNIDYTKDFLSWEKEILQFSTNFTFEKLKILEFIEGNEISYVTFHAKLTLNGKDNSFTEKSKFEKVDNRWLYLSGVHL